MTGYVRYFAAFLYSYKFYRNTRFLTRNQVINTLVQDSLEVKKLFELQGKSEETLDKEYIEIVTYPLVPNRRPPPLITFLNIFQPGHSYSNPPPGY